jgi:protein-disulfide isomerase
MTRIAIRHRLALGLLAAILAAPTIHAQVTTPPAAREKIIQFIREHFSIPANVQITITDLRETPFAEFYETTVTLDDGKEKRVQPMFVAKNMRYMVEGSIFNLEGNPRADIVRLISLKDQPAIGPANAPVTLVEYSDLECPVCARLQEELESEIIPKYGDKLRVVFKEFPLVAIHDWALPAAIAAQCIDELEPSKYAAFRSTVYKNQPSISAEHARDMLLHFAAEAGVDSAKLPDCLDAKASLPRVEANMREAEALGVDQTPTMFINGRAIVGALPTVDIEKIIDEALAANK